MLVIGGVFLAQVAKIRHISAHEEQRNMRGLNERVEKYCCFAVLCETLRIPDLYHNFCNPMNKLLVSGYLFRFI